MYSVNQDILHLIPRQTSGKETTAAASLTALNEFDAKINYQVIKDRLLNVNNWHAMAGFVSARFQITNEKAEPLTSRVTLGNYLRIDIPGPGSHAGAGFDWVIVEEMKELNEDQVDCIGFRVRPTRNPAGGNDIAHFYSGEATSTFLLTRDHSTVTVTIADKNLSPNGDAKAAADTLRHSLVGEAAIGLFSKIQWKHLADALVKDL